MMRRTKIVLASGAAVVALGAGTGVAAAATAGNPAAAGAVSASSSAKPSGSQAAGHGRGHGPGDRNKHRNLLRRVQHGELTLGGKKARVVDVQRGEVTAVSATSITVKSRDGYSHTYAFTKDSKVRKDREQSSASKLAKGDRVRLVAEHAGSKVLRLGAHHKK